MSDIPGWEGFYSITEDGRVWAHPRTWQKRRRHDGRWITPKLRGQYMAVGLCKDGKQKFFTLHTLMAKTYVPNPECKPCVNHKNGNKLDNSIANLEWCTASENCRHAWIMGLTTFTDAMRSAVRINSAKARLANRKLSAVDVEKIFGLRGLGMLQRDIGKFLNVTQTTIGNVLRGKYYGNQNSRRTV